MSKTYNHQLYKAFIKAFMTAMDENKGASIADIYYIAINSPAPSWFCSPRSAYEAIKHPERIKNNNLRCKYKALEVEARKLQKELKSSLAEAIDEIVERPAPSFYISEFLAHKIMGNYRKKMIYEKDKSTSRRN